MEKGLRKFEDFKEYKNLIEELMSDRVFNIKYSSIDNIFFIREMCDQYFTSALDEEKCIQISSMFSDLSKKIKEYKDIPPKEHYDAVEQERLEVDRKRLENEENNSKKFFNNKTNIKRTSELTVTDYLQLKIKDEAEDVLLYSHLSSFAKRDDGCIDSSISYRDGYPFKESEKAFQNVIGETVAHDEYGIPRKRIKLKFVEVKLDENKMIFKEKDMQIEEEDINDEISQ